MSVGFWALPATGPALFLPDRTSYTLSDGGDFGALTITYPTSGRNFAALAALDLDDRPVELEARIDGTDANAVGFLLINADGDRTREGDWTFTGRGISHLLTAAKLLHGSGENGNTEIIGTAGLIVRTLMQDAQGRGVLVAIDYSSFSNTHDSSGLPWAREVGVSLSPGQDYAQVLGVLQAYDACEWEIRRAPIGAAKRWQLWVYNPGALGVDRTVPGVQVTLERGRDQEDAPVRRSVLEVGTFVQVYGANGLRSSAVNATAEARLGRRIEVFRSFNNVADQGTLDALTQATAQAIGDGAHEQSHALNIGAGTPRPGVHFRRGDWLLSAGRGTVRPLRVAQWTLTEEDGSERAAVTLGDLIDERDVRLARRIDAITSGSVVVGTSVPQPDTDDGRAPAAPTGVVGSSVAFYDREGTGLAQVTAQWTAVTENADGTAIGDLAGYVVQYELLQAVPPSGWITVADVRAEQTSVTVSPLPPGQPIRLRVLAYDRYGRVSAASAPYPMTTATDADAPPVPSAPVVTSYLGILTVQVDGKGSAGEDMPRDFSHFEIHAAPSLPAFTVDRPDGGIDGSTTYVDRMFASGLFPIALATYGTEWFVRIVAVDKSGNASAASAADSAVLVRAADGDLAGMSIGKLTAGILSAIMTVSGIIRTAAAGARVELDAGGLRCIAADGRILFEFSIPNSLLTIVGRLIAGAGIGQGATVVVDPATAALVMYPDATTRRVEARAYNSSRPGGGSGPTFRLASLNASGVEDGPILNMWTTGMWFFMKNSAGQNRGGRLVFGRPGGGSSDPGEIARLSYERSDGDIPYVQAGAGGVFLAGAGHPITTDSPIGEGNGLLFHAQNGSGEGYRMVSDGAVLRVVENASNQYLNDGAGGLKSFVIDHPTDPARWLVHGCTESPTAGVEYTGEAIIIDHAATVDLPPYFEALTRPEGRHVLVSVVLPDVPGDVPATPCGPSPIGPPAIGEPWPRPGTPARPAVPEWAQLPAVAASAPRSGRFRIACSGADGTRVSWRVFAARADVAFDVEPFRSAVDVHGDGPYRYLTRREGA